MNDASRARPITTSKRRQQLVQETRPDKQDELKGMERRPGSSSSCGRRYLRLSWKPADALLPPSAALFPPPATVARGASGNVQITVVCVAARTPADLLWGGTFHGCSLVKTAAIVFDCLIFLLCLRRKELRGRETR